MRLSPVAVASLLVCATTGCTVRSGSPLPSPWALTYPDSSPVSSGRVVRFGGNYGLLGPSPAVVFREVNGQVSGQMLVWYRRYDPAEAGGAASDSVRQWSRMQSAMAADRAKFDSTYGCASWAKGYQEGKAWVCRVPEQYSPVHWAAELARLDSLAGASRAAEQGAGRRGDPVAPPPPPSNPGATPLRPRDGACVDGGNWYIQTRDTRGARVITSPQPGIGCLPPDSPAKTYDQAGWQMLKEFIAAVR